MDIYYKKFEDFLKKHNLYDEEIINYKKENSKLFAYRDENCEPSFGCHYIFPNGQLDKIYLIDLFIDNDIAILTNIYHYIHLVEAYKMIGENFDINDVNDKIKILPTFYANLFITENLTDELIRFRKDFENKTINGDCHTKYKLALECRDKLMVMHEDGVDINELLGIWNKGVEVDRLLDMYNKGMSIKELLDAYNEEMSVNKPADKRNMRFGSKFRIKKLTKRAKKNS